MPQCNARSVRFNQVVLQMLREMGVQGTNVGTLTDQLLTQGVFSELDRPVLYQRTLRALKLLQSEGLAGKVGHNWVAREEAIEADLIRSLAEAVAEVAARSPAAADVGLLRAALVGLADSLEPEHKEDAPMVGKDLARMVLGR